MSMSTSDAYKTLGLPLGSCEDAVKSAYRKLALQWHPDKHCDKAVSQEESKVKFQEISQAYQKLTKTELPYQWNLEQHLECCYALFRHLLQFGFFDDAGIDSECSCSDQSWISEDYDDDDDDYDGDDDYDTHAIGAARHRQYLRRRKKVDSKIKKGESAWKDVENRPTEQQAEKNAQELISEEERERSRKDKQKMKNKRQRERKKEAKSKEKEMKMNGNAEGKENTNELSERGTTSTNNSNQASIKKSKQSSKSKATREDKRENTAQEEDELDVNSAFVSMSLRANKTSGKRQSNAAPEKQSKRKAGTKNHVVKQEAPTVAKAGTKPRVPDVEDEKQRSVEIAVKGNQAAKDERYLDAILFFDEAIRLNPGDYRYFSNRSYCFERLGNFDQALKDAETSIALSKNFAKGFFRQGRALVGKERWPEAEAAFIRVLKSDATCKDAEVEIFHCRCQQIKEVGFSASQSEEAIRKYNNVQVALDNLINASQEELSSSASVKTSDDPLEDEIYYSEEDDYEQNAAVAPPVARAAPSSSKPKIITKSQQSKMQTIKNVDLSDDKFNPSNVHGLKSLWIGNLLPEVTEVMLNTAFSKYGNVTLVRKMPDRYCGFVNYATAEQAGHAMRALQGVDICGKNIVIKFPNNPRDCDKVCTSAVASGKKKSAGVSAQKQQADGRHVSECPLFRGSGCHRGKKCKFIHKKSNEGIDLRNGKLH